MKNGEKSKMPEYSMGEIEMKFAQMIWENEPIQSGELAKMAEAAFGWKKSTTYTIIKRLCNKGIIKNDNGTVSSLITYDEFRAGQTAQIIDGDFSGSLISFVSAFVSKKKLTKNEIDELQKIIDDSKANKNTRKK